MAMPSRKKMALWIFIAFVVIFAGALAWYFLPGLFTTTSYDEDGNPVREVDLFPFGGDGGGFDYDIFNNDDEPDDDLVNINPEDVYGGERPPRLRIISEGPVIGATMFSAEGHSGLVGSARATTTDEDVANTFRYIELGTGHVYEGRTTDGVVSRISNTTIPDIDEAEFVDQDRVLIRYTDDSDRIKTFSAELADNFGDSSSAPKRLQGIFLPDNILDVDVSPEGTLGMIVPDGDEYSVRTSDAVGDNTVELYRSPLSEWRVGWHGSNDTMLLQSTPSYETYGVAYTLDTSNGALRPYTTGRKALQVKPSASYDNAMISLYGDDEMRLYVWNRESNQYIDLSIDALAEKCTWAQARGSFFCATPMEDLQEGEPDLWYQGVTSYTDQVWQIDATTGQAQLVLSGALSDGRPFDIVDLQISPDEQFLYFRDKTSRALWSFQLDYDNASSNETTPEPDPDFFE